MLVLLIRERDYKAAQMDRKGNRETEGHTGKDGLDDDNDDDDMSPKVDVSTN